MQALSLGNAIASASSITPTHDVHHVTGNTTINTINPPSPSFCGKVVLIIDGTAVFSNAGNIATNVGTVTGHAYVFVYDPNTST